MITTAPTGKLIRGTILDVDQKTFDRALRRYDSQLYTKWNPHKLRGWGCWEIRRRPELKSVVECYVIDDITISRVEFKEVEILSHVLDCAFLNYDQFRKLYKMDTWRPDHWINDIEYNEKKRQQEIRGQQKDALKHAIRQNKNVFKQFKELVQSGYSPARLVTSDKWVYKTKR